MNAIIENENKVIPMYPNATNDIFKMNTVTMRKKRNGLANIIDNPVKHSADAFTSIYDIDKMVVSLLTSCKKDSLRKFTKAAIFITGINTGFRCGDLLSLRVRDVICNHEDPSSDIVDMLYVCEDKTEKPRKVYINKAVKTVLRFIIDVNEFKPNDYLFIGEGNRTAYFDGYVYDDDGNVIDTRTSNERYREDGTERQPAAYTVPSVTRWLKAEAKKLKINGHYSSHCMRKTFANFISENWVDKRNPLAACQALNHSNPDITIKYYMAVDPVQFKEKWMDLNLGLEVLEIFIRKYSEANK